MIIAMLDQFLIRAGAAAVGAAVLAGPLGCFALWRRGAATGDASGHAALLGAALGVAFGFSPALGGGAAAAALGVLATLAARRRYGFDAALGALAHGALALALVVFALTPRAQGALEAWLFGDVLAASWADAALIWGAALAGLGVLAAFWRPLMGAVISPELAAAEGGRPERAKLILALLTGAFMAGALTTVGALLATGLLILPAAAARPLARSPEGMALMAALIGALAAVAGLGGSLALDAPAGPMITLAAAIMFGLTNFAANLRNFLSRRG